MFVSLALVWLCVCFFFLQLKFLRPKNFPPGPYGLPLLGNLLHFNMDNPLKDFERCKHKTMQLVKKSFFFPTQSVKSKLKNHYGDVYSIFIGHRPAVILNGLKAIKEAIITKGSDYAGRPENLFINGLFQGKGLILQDYGTTWKEHRRFALMTLRNFGMGKKSMEDRIHGEIQYILQTLENNIGTTISPQVMFHNAVSNIICQVLFNTRYDYDDDIIRTTIRCITRIRKYGNGPWAKLCDILPVIQNLPLPFRKAFKSHKSLQTFISNMVTEHMRNRIPGEPKDLLDCYLDELEQKGAYSSFSHDRLVGLALDIFGAGTDTTSNTFLTGFLYLTCYPDIQERCQEEIDRVLDGKSCASFEDRHNMPYVQAMIHEVQRIANIVPLSITHSTRHDTEVMGYSIPKGTMIIENLTSVLNEDGKWKFPQDFNPENFLNEQGEFVKPEAFMPFSAGPRVCIGEGLARMELFLITVTLLRKYKFIWPEDAGKPDLNPVYSLVMTTKPYRMRVQVRDTE